MTDAPDDVVQPEGQGDEGTNAPPYAEYLNRIPEEARGPAEEAFRAWDADTTRKFQEHSEYRKGWEPYEQLGVNELSPDQVQWALQFYQAAESNPSAVQQWWESYAQERGLTPKQAQQEPQQQQDDPYATDAFDGSEQVAKLLDARLGPVRQQLEQFEQWREQQESQARKAEADRYIEGQLTDLASKHGDQFNREAVESFVPKYIQQDPLNAVPRAWADYQNLVNQIQKRTLQEKVDQPAPAESGGAVSNAPEPIRTLAEASRIAREQLRAQNLA